jgi:hypothetical protein
VRNIWLSGISPVTAEAASPDSAPTPELVEVAEALEDAAVVVDREVEEPQPAAANSPSARVMISRFAMCPMLRIRPEWLLNAFAAIGPGGGY